MNTLSETISSIEALNRLKNGNERFSRNLLSLTFMTHQERRQRLVGRQNPFAIILSCSDSRVPSEIIFDQGLGDLFVIRVAGNIVAPSIIGSIEFAVSSFNTQLVVVMGHSHCGAVSAALDAEQFGKGTESKNIQDIVSRIAPGIKLVVERNAKSKSPLNREDILEKCIQANIYSSLNELRQKSPIIRDLVFENKLLIVGAEYQLQTGKVNFFDNPQENHGMRTKSDRVSKSMSMCAEVIYDQ